MKREFYKRVYFCRLNTELPLEVFRASLARIKSYALFDAVVRALRPADLESFFGLVADTTYELPRTCILETLFGLSFTRAAAEQFMRLSIGPVAGAAPPTVGIYNYCCYKRLRGDYTVDLRAGSMGQAAANRAYSIYALQSAPITKSHGGDREPKSDEFIYTSFTDEEFALYREVLREMCAANRDSEELRAYVSAYAKDEYLLALLDGARAVACTGRSPADLLLLAPAQLTAVSADISALLAGCRANAVDGRCTACGNRVHGAAAAADRQAVTACFENALFEEDTERICGFLDHHPFLRTANHLKILLRLLGVVRWRAETGECASNRAYRADAACMARMIARAVGLFELDDAGKGMVISFLKQSSHGFAKTLCLIPHVMKDRQLYFGCFAVMHSQFAALSTKPPVRSVAGLAVKDPNAYLLLRIRGLVAAFKERFDEVADMIIDHQLGSARDSDGEEDLEYLRRVFSVTADMYGVSPACFVQTYFFDIFLAALGRGGGGLSPAFVRDNGKFVVIKKILDGRSVPPCNDTDVMVGLMFNGCFELAGHFEPSPAAFIKAHLSQLLFKIKNAYLSGSYRLAGRSASHSSCGVPGRHHFIYEILRCVLENLCIPRFFNYLWPTIEFFLNKEECECSMRFVEWLRCEHYSPLMVPYMRMPFASAEDLPVAGNMDGKLHAVLLRFFLGRSNGNGAAMAAGSPMCVSMPCSASAPMLLSFPSPAASPKPEPFDSLDEFFIDNFLGCYAASKVFRAKILELYPGCDATTRALLGNLRSDARRDALARAPADIPQSILENFLIKIDHNQQEFYSFIIQEFLKIITAELPPAVESVVQQFRYTKYELKDERARFRQLEAQLTGASRFCLGGSYADFLRSLMLYLHGLTAGYECMRYLVLLSSDVVEYAALCLLKICHATVPRFDLAPVISAVDAYYTDRVVCTDSVACSDSKINADSVVYTDRVFVDIARFLLKINIFVGAQLVPHADYLRYALGLRDHHAVVYALDGAAAPGPETELLQLTYAFMGDSVRVKGFNLLRGSHTPFSLFLDFCADKNYPAARQCFAEYCAALGVPVPGAQRLPADWHGSERSGKGAFVHVYNGDGATAATAQTHSLQKRSSTSERIVQMMAEILQQEEEAGAQLSSDPADYEAESGRGHGSALHVALDCRLLRVSRDAERTAALVHRRRAVAENRDEILQMHRAVAARIGLPAFTRALELEHARGLRRRRDDANCARCLARLVLQREWGALYELALLRIDQKSISEAKELLRRVIAMLPPSDELHCRSAAKLCEIAGSKAVFVQQLSAIEKSTQPVEGVENITIADSAGSSIRRPKEVSVDDVVSRLSRPGAADAGAVDSSPADASRGGWYAPENFRHLQRIYFLAAKYFEASNVVASLGFYYKSFESNYEAVPKFFHLLADAPQKEMPLLEQMIASTVRGHLRAVLPYYNQISNKLSITGPSFALYNTVVQAMLEAAPHETFWDTLYLVNSRREDVRRKAQALVDGLSFPHRVMFRSIQKIAEQLILISKSKLEAPAIADFGIAELFPAAVNVPGCRALIHGIRDEVVVFASLQRPKRIVFLGDDGAEYPMIVKFKDDLRKDSRVTDLNNLLNKLFAPGYYIRTYRVIPFTHDAGIIEFVPGMASFKQICTRFYKKQINDTSMRFASYRRVGGNNMAKVREGFPPVLHDWLKQQHPDPYAFYTRRDNYVKTYAIMCAVGWFIGLGDRHAENTHFDLASGDTVHVDLNCIFDRGRAFDIPERVPFRLTHNIVDGCGSLGLAGTFTHTMCYTLRLMRANKDMILANLLSFVFDPLFEWARKKNEPARIIEALRERLQFEEEEEVTDQLIEEATDLNNLGNMYIGWTAFL
ncbi:serine/threonine-protein kinase ATR [Pancytospora philotis]|nr:serine/threonine-protein kinase ATR [Pancytospora philotis]